MFWCRHISHTTNLLLFKFRCSIFIGVRIIKEMPGSVARGTSCILSACVYKTNTVTKFIQTFISKQKQCTIFFQFGHIGRTVNVCPQLKNLTLMSLFVRNVIWTCFPFRMTTEIWNFFIVVVRTCEQAQMYVRERSHEVRRKCINVWNCIRN